MTSSSLKTNVPKPKKLEQCSELHRDGFSQCTLTCHANFCKPTWLFRFFDYHPGRPWKSVSFERLALIEFRMKEKKKSIHLPNSTKLVHWPPWAASQSSRQTLLSFGLQTWDPLVAQDPHSHWPCMKLTMKSFFLKHLTYALVLEFQLAHWVRWPPGLLLNRSCLAISDSKWALWENYGNAKLQNDSNSNRP